MSSRGPYNWKHGWIPLTRSAAVSKAHGSHKAAKRAYRRSYGTPRSKNKISTGRKRRKG